MKELDQIKEALEQMINVMDAEYSPTITDVNFPHARAALALIPAIEEHIAGLEAKLQPKVVTLDGSGWTVTPEMVRNLENNNLKEMLNELRAENEQLKAQLARLQAPVTDEELWECAFIIGREMIAGSGSLTIAMLAIEAFMRGRQC